MTPSTTIQTAVARIDALHSRLPDAWRASFLPYFLALLPLLFASTVLPRPYITPLLVLTLLALYHVATINEAALFAVSTQRAHWVYMMPFFTFVPLAALLTFTPHFGLTPFLTTIIPTSLCLLLLIAPAQRFNRSRTARRFPLRYTFPAVSALALLMHCLPA
jgi:hypothetical protein